jgi:23S rRNA (uridine2552-2'-O)-methyltransferase
MDRHVNDYYVKQSKLQAYRSRAAFKLMEIDDRHKLLKPGIKVIDVGSAPGGWSQVLANKTQSIPGRENIVSVDLLDMDPVEGVVHIVGDIEKEKTQDEISDKFEHERVEMVVSDAVPEFIGDRFIDHINAI